MSSTGAPNLLLKLAAGMFGASLNTSLYAELSAQLEAGTPLRNIAREFAGTDVFSELYRDTSPLLFANQVACQLLGLDLTYDFESAAAAPDFRNARDWVRGQLAETGNRGETILNAVIALDAIQHPGYVDSRTRLENQAQLAEYYVAMGGAADTLAALRAVLDGISSDQQSVGFAISRIDLLLGNGSRDNSAGYLGRFDQRLLMSEGNPRDIRVQLEGGATYVVQAETAPGSLIDPVISYVMDGDGRVLPDTANNDYFGRNAQLLLQPESSGSYSVRFDSAQAMAGAIIASLREVSASSVGYPLLDAVVGGVNVGMIDTPFSQHQYAVHLDAGVPVTIQVSSSDAFSNPLRRPKLIEIRGLDGEIIPALPSTGSAFAPSSLSFTAVQTGTYKILVGDSYNDIGAYRLEIAPLPKTTLTVSAAAKPAAQKVGGVIERAGMTFDNDLPATPHSAAPINEAKAVRGAIEGPGDIDWLPIHLVAGQRYQFSLQGLATGQGTLSDPVIQGVADSSGNFYNRTWDDDSGSGKNALLSFVAPVTEQGFVSVLGYGKQTGNYLLSMTEEPVGVPGTPTNTPDTVSFPAPAARGTWTVLVYMAADNDLEAFAISDLNEMEAATLPSGVNVVTLVDRAPGFDRSNGNWGDTRIGVIAHDDNPGLITSPLATIGEANTGSKETLADFIDWATNTQPAEHYALVLWNHGAGVGGIGFDASSANRALSPADVAAAIAASAIGKMEVVGFDACSMAILEQAYPLRNHADIMVSSQDLEPADGWDYSDWLTRAFSGNAQPRPEAVAAAAVTSFDTTYAKTSSITLSTLDLKSIGAVTDELNAFASIASSTMPTDWSAIRAARQAALYTESNQSVDMLGFSLHLADSDIASTALRAAAEDLANAVTQSVTQVAGNIPGAAGLAGYWPQHRPYDFEKSYANDAVELVGSHAWADFLSAYWSH